MPIRTHLLQHIVYIYRGPVWVDDIYPVWIITWHRSLSLTVMIPSGIYRPFGSHITWNRSLSRTMMIPSGIYGPFGSHITWHRSLSRIVMIPSGIYR